MTHVDKLGILLDKIKIGSQVLKCWNIDFKKLSSDTGGPPFTRILFTQIHFTQALKIPR